MTSILESYGQQLYKIGQNSPDVTGHLVLPKQQMEMETA